MKPKNSDLPNKNIIRLWHSIKYRCYGGNNSHSSYSKRKIKMCKEWRNSLHQFYKWCELNGWEKGLDIDRIDNNGNYAPYNCRFINRSANCRNKSNNRLIEINGQIKTLKEWCEIYNISYLLVHYRLCRSTRWDTIKALTTPPHRIKK